MKRVFAKYIYETEDFLHAAQKPITLNLQDELPALPFAVACLAQLTRENHFTSL